MANAEPREDHRPTGWREIRHYLDAAPGVVRVEVHPPAGMATIEFDPELCSDV